MPRNTKTTVETSLGVRKGRNVKIARTRLGKTQSQLAKALDLENVTGSRTIPSTDRLEEITKAFKVSLTALLADTSKSGAYAEMLAEEMTELPARDKEFFYGFALTYAQHLRAEKKKL